MFTQSKQRWFSSSCDISGYNWLLLQRKGQNPPISEGCVTQKDVLVLLESLLLQRSMCFGPVLDVIAACFSYKAEFAAPKSPGRIHKQAEFNGFPNNHQRSPEVTRGRRSRPGPDPSLLHREKISETATTLLTRPWSQVSSGAARLSSARNGTLRNGKLITGALNHGQPHRQPLICPKYITQTPARFQPALIL